jgi:hypothetical protein
MDEYDIKMLKSAYMLLKDYSGREEGRLGIPLEWERRVLGAFDSIIDRSSTNGVEQRPRAAQQRRRASVRSRNVSGATGAAVGAGAAIQ